MIETASPRYFAASNSCEGFRNYYGDIFTDTRVDRLYIVKGGPGTGKSHFMKTVARRGRELGYRVTEYACSSDPASLDGVLLTRRGAPTVGLLDGTPPHVREPILPGVREEILNLGQFWNSRHLMGQGDAIRRLAAEKSAAFGRAYAFLAAAGEVEQAADSRMDPCIRENSLEALADRILRRFPAPAAEETGGREGQIIPALRRGVSMSGQTCLHTFERMAAEAGGLTVILEDHYGLAARVTRILLERLRAAGHTLLVSYDPVFPRKIDGLYHEDSGICVLAGYAEAVEGSAVRSVSLRRLADARALRDVRGELRRACALREELIACALQEMASASGFHFELERIYAEAMDFGAKETFTENFCRELWG
jgi:hypothetical protein